MELRNQESFLLSCFDFVTETDQPTPTDSSKGEREKTEEGACSGQWVSEAKESSP